MTEVLVELLKEYYVCLRNNNPYDPIDSNKLIQADKQKK